MRRDLFLFAADCAVAFLLALLVFQLFGTGWPVVVAVVFGAVLVGLALGAVDARERRDR